MEKRYQVFISSTFADLQEERQEVMQALLELDCIPAGMELFPAANEDQWTLIKKVIEDCDYYMVIVAGRYGSIGPGGLSYTEMEYRYAVESGKPIIGFSHRDPEGLAASRCESTDEGRAKLATFRELIQTKMCRFWDSPADLGSQVSRSLIKLIKAHPGIGWVRGDMVPEQSVTEEILKLRKQIEELETEAQATRVSGPAGSESLAQGEDRYKLNFSFVASPDQYAHHGTSYRYSVAVTWNEIFASISPLMISEAPEEQVLDGLNSLARETAVSDLSHKDGLENQHLMQFTVFHDDFQTIKVQLRALGLIVKSTKSRSVKDNHTYWTLTPYGDTIMTTLRAIRREPNSAESTCGEEETQSPSDVMTQ